MSTIDVAAGETFSGTVNASDTLVVEAGGQTVGATILGTETVEAGGLSSGDTVEAGGYLAGDESSFPLEGAISDVTIAGGTVVGLYAELEGGVNFTGTGGRLYVDGSVNAPITGFAAGDGIAIQGSDFFLGASLTVSGDAVTYEVGGSVPGLGKDYNFDIVGASDDNLQLYDLQPIPGDSLADIPTIVCFLAGVTIATPEGGRTIETLRAGDLVLTAEGAARPIRWLGRQTVAASFADPLRVAPIRIREGALAENLPVRDLLVSPDHALMVDNVFVQAGALVNGVSIVREALPETLIYFHVELADHSLILAEGIPAETFIDNVDRLAFDNWDEHVADGAPMSEMLHARAKSHRQVPQALRARLMARGVELYGSDIAAVA